MISAKKIAAWREANLGAQITERILLDILGLKTLRGANLRRVDLNGADLRGADLSGANLNGADLRGADLRGANLRRVDLNGADLRGADLRGANLNGADLHWSNLNGADLRGADLRGADLRNQREILALDTPSGSAVLVPTCVGWHLEIGCWMGNVDELRELITSDDWPEAKGEERERRRPILTALADLCEAHMGYHADVVPALAKRWSA